MKIINKYIALILVVMISLANINLQVFANEQRPVQNVHYEYIVDKNTNELLSDVNISWDNPEWAPGSTPGETHVPQYFWLDIYDRFKSASNHFSYIINNTDKTNRLVSVDNYYKLDPSHLYEIKIIPEHKHGEHSITPYYNETLQLLTELDVTLVPHTNSIDIIWEDLEKYKANLGDNVTYDITYLELDNLNEEDIRYRFESSIEKNHVEVDSIIDGKLNTMDGKLKHTIDGKLKYTIDGLNSDRFYAVTVVPKLTNKNIIVNKEPKVFSTHSKIKLDVKENGDYVELKWDINSTFEEPDKVNIYMYYNKQLKIITLDNNNSNTWRMKLDKRGEYEFQIKVTYKDNDKYKESDKVPFSFKQIKIQPNKPKIPKPISEDVIQADEENIEDYCVPGDDDVTDFKEELLNDDRTFHVLSDNSGLNIPWSAFRHRDYNQEAEDDEKIITDFDVKYDIWVTNRYEDLSKDNTKQEIQKIASDLEFNENDLNNLIRNKDHEVVGFNYTVTQYYDSGSDEEEAGIKNIVPNQIYYIKIIAKNSKGKSEPEIATIYFNYDGEVCAPPVMSRPPLEVREQGKDYGSIQWKQQWYEIISNDSKTGIIKNWQNKFWVDNEGNIYSEKPEESVKCREVILDNKYEDKNGYKDNLVDQIRNICDIKSFSLDDYTIRKIDLSAPDIKYSFACLDLDEKSDSEKNISDYLNEIIQDDENNKIEWKEDIKISIDASNNVVYYEKDSLEPNHEYIFLIKPYRELFDGIKAEADFPAAILISTAPEQEELNPQPPVPDLSIEDLYSDTEIKLIWNYNKDFEYEIMYSEQEDISTAQQLEIVIDDIEKYENNYYYYRVAGLFPDSTYYFWIRALPKVESEDAKPSKMSHAVLGQTLDIQNPDPPRGVGRGSKQKLKDYDIKEPTGLDYITVEWVLNELDTYGDIVNNEEKQPVLNREYSYILEISDNMDFLDAMTTVISDDSVGGTDDKIKVLDKNLVQVIDLISNKEYYIRMKTRVKVSSNSTNKVIEKESLEYSDVIWLITNQSGNDYDSNTDPSKEKLPDQDYEITYDRNKQLLTFRFRMDQEGDNHVDQRLIADLIKHNKFDYEIKVDRYKNEPIKTRLIKIPYNLIKDFDSYNINLNINAGDFHLAIPYEALKDQIYENAYSYGKQPVYLIQIETLPSYEQRAKMPSDTNKILSQAYDVNIMLANELRDQLIYYPQKQLNVKVRPINRYQLYEMEYDAFQYNHDSNMWETKPSELERSKGLISFNVDSLGTFGVYGTINSSSTNSNQTHWSDQYKQAVMSKVSIQGLNTNYNSNDKVANIEMVNIAKSLIESNNSINLRSKISNSDLNQLYQAGILKNSNLYNYITRKDALNMFIKSYELATGTQINSNNYISKAYKIGIISNKKFNNPDDYLTYGEMFYLLNSYINNFR